MKGVLLAGGKGTRLRPCSLITNKHLLPVYDRPMIYYPIATLVGAGITEIMVVTGREHMGAVMEILGSGREFGAEFTYRIQDQAGGIAEALLLARAFVNTDNVAVILGDNIFEDTFSEDVREFEFDGAAGQAKVFLKRVPDPSRFGVATVHGERVIEIAEKPALPKSDLAVTGLYFYDCSVFDMLEHQTYSERGELEISDTNNDYLDRGLLTYRVLEGFWSDAGTWPSLMRAARHCQGDDHGDT